MARRLPLSALLSFALVAFTIEADNEAEHRIPHRTTRHGATEARGAWLTSMAMWFNCLRWVPEQGRTVREVERLARTQTNWDGMRRWGHIRFEPSSVGDRAKPSPALVVQATANGRRAQQAWSVLIPEIEARWRERFGADAERELREALTGIAVQLDAALPDCMPILKHGLVSEGPKRGKPPAAPEEPATLPLPALLARVLLAWTLDFEQESRVSLAICADVLRVIGEEGTAVRDLPAFSGVSKEAIAMALSFLMKRGYALVQAASPGSRLKVVRPTPEGILAQGGYEKHSRAIERRWLQRHGKATLEGLRKSLERLTGDGTAEGSPLFAGLKPYPDGWRAAKPTPRTLPHYPMVLHRGGYPDGS